MAKPIVDIDPREMSFIRNEYKGERWSPVNGDAVVLTVKGEPDSRTLADKAKDLIAAVKAYFPSYDMAEEVPQTFPVSEDVPDNIDNDGDGASDYSAYALAICYAAADINQAIGLQEPARSEAIVSIVDKFRSEAREQFGDTEKAGRRHSAKDQAAIDGMKEAHAKMGEHLAALDASGGDSEKAEADETPVAEAPATANVVAVEGNVVAEPPAIEEIVKGQVEALIAERSAEFEQQIATVKAEAESQIQAVRADSESRVAHLEGQLQDVTQRAEKAEALVKAAVAEASTPSSPGFVPTRREDGKHDDPAAQVTKAEAISKLGSPSKISEVIQLQRLVRS
jgi:hypothetical protein